MTDRTVQPLQNGGSRVVVQYDLREEYGWRRLVAFGVVLWLKGYSYSHSDQAIAEALGGTAGGDEALRATLAGIDGHFALVCEADGWAVAAVDRIRSIPIFMVAENGEIHIGSQAARLASICGLRTVDPTAALAIAMAGYSCGTDTLYRGLQQAGPGEFFLVDTGGTVRRERYHRYEPWRAEAGSDNALSGRLAEVTLEALQKVIASAAGRPIVVPLSAGLDSRLVASGLVHLGYRNLRCYAYGLPGNYEARASRRIAEQLGVSWRFEPLTASTQRAFYASARYRDYVAFSDSCASTPFVQDLPVLMQLRKDGYVADDAIIINGNTGDYISGMHVPPPLRKPRGEMGDDERLALILDSQIEKHYRLWSALGTKENDDVIRARLRRQLADEGGIPRAPDTDHGLYEYLEFANRQCKYVVTGQRMYEFLGLEWRLPLWDSGYLDFWQRAPLAAKVRQRLYRQMLESENWGGVWGESWRFPHHVSPAWMRWLVRPVLKALHAPLGRSRWHRFERRYLGYWMDLWGAQAVVPYLTAARDRRGARHFVSWHTVAYLRRHGLDWDGGPIDGAGRETP